MTSQIVYRYLSKGQSVVDVGGENSCSQTVGGVIRPLNHLLHGGELEDALDWPKYFLPGDGHVILDPREDCRLGDST